MNLCTPCALALLSLSGSLFSPLPFFSSPFFLYLLLLLLSLFLLLKKIVH